MPQPQRHIRQFRLDAYVMETLMADLVLHDRQPSAFLVYLHLWYRSAGNPRTAIRASHQDIADATGLSKSAVQGAIRTLTRRRLVHSARAGATAVPEYTVLRPWRPASVSATRASSRPASRVRQ